MRRRNEILESVVNGQYCHQQPSPSHSEHLAVDRLCPHRAAGTSSRPSLASIRFTSGQFKRSHDSVCVPQAWNPFQKEDEAKSRDLGATISAPGVLWRFYSSPGPTKCINRHRSVQIPVFEWPCRIIRGYCVHDSCYVLHPPKHAEPDAWASRCRVSVTSSGWR